MNTPGYGTAAPYSVKLAADKMIWLSQTADGAGIVVAATGLGSGHRGLTAQEPPVFTRADSLRGSVGPDRAWWDVTFYDLHVRVNPADSSITGWNGITYRVLEPGQEMQIDLQMPLRVDSMIMAGRKLSYRRDGNAFFVSLPARP